MTFRVLVSAKTHGNTQPALSVFVCVCVCLWGGECVGVGVCVGVCVR